MFMCTYKIQRACECVLFCKRYLYTSTARFKFQMLELMINHGYTLAIMLRLTLDGPNNALAMYNMVENM
jgi:hypothetical protein